MNLGQGLRLVLPRLLHTSFCCSSTGTTLRCAVCSWVHHSASQDSCRSWLAMLPVASLRPVQNRPSQTGRPLGLPLLMAFGSCNPSGILLCCKPCSLCCVQFVPLCQQHQLQTELLAELPTDFSISTSISCFRSSASSALVDLASLPRSSSVFVLLLLEKSLFSTRQLSIPHFNLFFNLKMVSSYFLGDLPFMLCCNVLMTFSILVSRHRSNFFLQDIVLLELFQPAVGHALQSSSPIGNLPLPLSLTPFRHWLFWLWFFSLFSLSSGVASPSTTLWKVRSVEGIMKEKGTDESLSSPKVRRLGSYPV